ncbi:MAG TPA: carbonic anhydrase family protein [Rhodocyclaceae bacterium]|nr:carbonic anhydrase family protein [Rhodocyclaceae bacterium]
MRLHHVSPWTTIVATSGATLGVAIALAFAAMPAAAVQAQWQKVGSGHGETVFIDVGRIALADNGRIQAWSRLALARPVDDAESGEAYNLVEVLNSYDCASGRYAPVKRIFLHGDKMLKVEPVYSAKDQAATPGPDAALVKEVCRNRPAVALLPKKDSAGKAAPAGDAKFSVMHAELVTETKEPVKSTKVVAVADKPADKPADSGRIEPKRMIDLPKIDKSQVEKPSDAKPAEKGAEKPASDRDKGATEKEKASADKDKIRSTPGPVDSSLSGIDKHTRELALATTGPRRIVRRKPALKDIEPAVVEHAHIHWSYEGEGGPNNWAKIDDQNAVCGSGKRQSPIDIADGIRVDLETIKFDYKPTLFRIEDNGHTIQVTPADGNTIKVMGRTYELKQFHFHRPSEEKVNGKRFDMVVHLVHKDDDGNIAVVAVLLEKGEAEQGVIQTLWNNMPLETGQSLTPSTAIDLNRLLPADRAYYTYMGSLTTPPCTEGVLWMVFKQPLVVTQDQVNIFSRLYRNNARPVQPNFGRLVKESR